MTTPATVRALAPEYAAETDEVLMTYLDFAAQRLDARAFGGVYAQAVAYLAAHILTIARRGVAGGAGGGAGAGQGASGAVTAVSTGDWSVSFAGGLNGSEGGVDTLAEASLMTTRFGKEFLALRRTRAASRSRVIKPG